MGNAAISPKGGKKSPQYQFPHPYFTMDKKKDQLGLGYIEESTGPGSITQHTGCCDTDYPKMSLQLYIRLSKGPPQERINHVTSIKGDKLNLAILLGWTDTAKEFLNMLDKTQLNTWNLIQAAQLQNLEIVKLLIEKGVDPMVMWEEKSNVLVGGTNVQVITAFGDVKNVRVGAQEFIGKHCILYELSRHNAPITMKYLLDYCIPLGFNINDKWSWGRTLLVFSCWNGSWDNVPILLDLGADPNIPDEYGTTPVQHALFGMKDYHQGNSNIALLLVQRGARLTDGDMERITGPLYQQILQAKSAYQQSNPQ